MTEKQPLRKRAEKTLKAVELQNLKALSAEETQSLIHELQVHQIELDMQNEELRQALAERDASHARYVDLYDLAPVGYCTLSEKGRILEANLTAATLLGVARSALIQQPFTRFILKEDQDLYYRHRKQLIESGESLACELRMVTKNGTLFWTRLEAAAAQGFSEGTEPTTAEKPVYRVMISNITERKQAEITLKELHEKLEERVSERTAELETALNTLKDDEERFRTVADFTYNWETWIGPDGKYIYVSPSSKRISGYFPWDFYKDPALMEKIIHPKDLPGWNKTLAEGLERKGEAFLEFRIIHSGGDERWVSLNSQSVFDRDGRWLGRRDSYRDTTDRKRAETELRESRARFQALVESTHDWVWETNPDGVYSYVSPRSVELLGYPPEEIVGRSPLEFIHPDKRKDARSRLKKTLETGKPFRGIERVFGHREGRSVIVESSGVPFFDSSGKLAGFRGIDRDITERKHLEAQTLRTRHLIAIGELAAGVAHEINNPINGIINYAQILADDASVSGSDPDIPLRIIKEGDRIAEIVKNLLYFSRQSHGKKEPVSVRTILEDSLSLFAAQFRKEGISVDLDIPDELPPVMGNRQQMQQVFMNILGNSRHALLRKPEDLKRNKQIEVKASVPKPKGVKMVTLCFFDNGMGIAPEFQERVFDPFFTTKALGEGTGLGLSISYGIINDHGGYLFIESEPREYTRVWVFLPASSAG